MYFFFFPHVHETLHPYASAFGAFGAAGRHPRLKKSPAGGAVGWPGARRGAGHGYFWEPGAPGAEGEAVLTEVGRQVVFPEVARLLEFLVGDGK